MAKADRLTREHRDAIDLLLSGLSPAEVAERLGISERTLRRWRNRPAFITAYDAEDRDARSESWDARREYRAKLAALQPVAVDGLADLLAPELPWLRLQAIGLALSHAARASDDDLDERLDALEARLDAADEPMLGRWQQWRHGIDGDVLNGSNS